MAKHSRLGVHGTTYVRNRRGDLHSQHRNAEVGTVVKPEEWVNPETDENYFVPSFSVRRHLHRDAEDAWIEHQAAVKKRIGSSYKMVNPEEVSIKIFEQRALIRGMKLANIHPDPKEIKDLASGLGEQLRNLLLHVESPLEVPLGRLAMFGPQDRPTSLAYEIAGWRGDKPNYGNYAVGSVARAMNDFIGYDMAENTMSPLAVIQAERRLVVGAATLAYGAQGLRAENMVVTPHVSFARPRKFIQEFRRHDIFSSLSDIALDSTLFGDPIVEVHLEKGGPIEQITVAHSYSSLGNTQEYAA